MADLLSILLQQQDRGRDDANPTNTSGGDGGSASGGGGGGAGDGRAAGNVGFRRGEARTYEQHAPQAAPRCPRAATAASAARATPPRRRRPRGSTSRLPAPPPHPQRHRQRSDPLEAGGPAVRDSRRRGRRASSSIRSSSSASASRSTSLGAALSQARRRVGWARRRSARHSSRGADGNQQNPGAPKLSGIGPAEGSGEKGSGENPKNPAQGNKNDDANKAKEGAKPDGAAKPGAGAQDPAALTNKNAAGANANNPADAERRRRSLYVIRAISYRDDADGLERAKSTAAELKNRGFADARVARLPRPRGAPTSSASYWWASATRRAIPTSRSGSIASRSSPVSGPGRRTSAPSPTRFRFASRRLTRREPHARLFALSGRGRLSGPSEPARTPTQESPIPSCRSIAASLPAAPSSAHATSSRASSAAKL